ASSTTAAAASPQWKGAPLAQEGQGPSPATNACERKPAITVLFPPWIDADFARIARATTGAPAARRGGDHGTPEEEWSKQEEERGVQQAPPAVTLLVRPPGRSGGDGALLRALPELRLHPGGDHVRAADHRHRTVGL